MLKRGFWLLSVMAAALVIIMPAAVLAVTNGGVGGRPAYPQPNNPRTSSIFIYQLKPGQQKTDGVRILNNTNQRQTIAVGAVDSVLSSGGAFACAQAVEQKKDVGAWIKLQANTVTLAPNSSQVVPFTVTVPGNAEVGEHDGCITIQAASQTAQPSGKSGVALSFRSAIRVVVTIPGKIVKQLDLTSVAVRKAADGKYIVMPVARNSGNVSLDTDVQVKLAGATAGGTYPVLPRTTAAWNFELKRPFWGGWYKANAAVTYNSNPTAELGINQGASQTKKLSSATFFVWPSAGAAVIEIIVLLVILGGIAWYVRRQRDVSHIRQHWRNYTVKESDDLDLLAKRYGVSWKKLARVNAIKPPYNLTKGQKLKVPPKRAE